MFHGKPQNKTKIAKPLKSFPSKYLRTFMALYNSLYEWWFSRYSLLWYFLCMCLASFSPLKIVDRVASLGSRHHVLPWLSPLCAGEVHLLCLGLSPVGQRWPGRGRGHPASAAHAENRASSRAPEWQREVRIQGRHCPCHLEAPRTKSLQTFLWADFVRYSVPLKGRCSFKRNADPKLNVAPGLLNAEVNAVLPEMVTRVPALWFRLRLMSFFIATLMRSSLTAGSS